MSENIGNNEGKNIQDDTPEITPFSDLPREQKYSQTYLRKHPRKPGKPKGLTVTIEKHQESKCWNCKRALNSPECHCEWSKKFRPVKGWKVEKGAKLSNGEARGLVVVECPEYVRWHEYEDWKDVMKVLVPYFGKQGSTLRKNLKYWLVRYCKETGRELPGWTFQEAEELIEREKRMKM